MSRQAGGRAAGGGGIGGPWSRRDQDRDRPAPDPYPRSPSCAARSATWTAPATPSARSAGATRCRRGDRRLHQRRQVQSCSTASPVPACWSRTRCSPPSTRRRAALETPTAGYVHAHRHRRVRPAPAAPSSSRRSARRWRRSVEADLLLHVVDGVGPDPRGQVAAVREVLADIGAGDVAEARRSTTPWRPRSRRSAASRATGSGDGAGRRARHGVGGAPARPGGHRDRQVAGLPRPAAAAQRHRASSRWWWRRRRSRCSGSWSSATCRRSSRRWRRCWAPARVRDPQGPAQLRVPTG
jgi:hypothetical protein